MTAVTFPNGNSYSDDGTTPNDMRDGGHRANLLPMIGDTITVASSAIAAAAAAVPAATTATAGATTATTQAAIATAAANTAAGIVQHVQPSEIAGIDPVLDFPFRASAAVPSGVITGSSGKWVTNQAGLLVNVASGTAPIDFDPVTAALRGLRVEPAATNLILGSDAPSTQSISVTAQAYTLSFYGTGSIVLSGAYSATVAGTGAYPSQKTLTFTPTSGTLTLTISVTVQYAQLETGAIATSYIKTVGSTVTRAADVNTLLLSSVPGWNASEGTIYAEIFYPNSATDTYAIQLDDGTNNNRISLWRWASNSNAFATVLSGGVNVAQFSSGAATTASSVVKAAIAFKQDDFATSFNGGAASTDAAGSLPSLTTLRLGAQSSGGSPLNGCIRRLTIFPRRLSNATLQLLTA